MAEEEISGFPSTLNEQQKTALKELEVLIKNNNELDIQIDQYNQDERFLLRALRATMKDKSKARTFQPKEAYERVKSIMEFKIKHNVWKEPKNYQLYRECYPRYAYFDTKVDRMISISRFGDFVNSVKVNHMSYDEWAECLGHEAELTMNIMDEYSDRRKVDNKGDWSITDMKGLSWKILTKKKVVSHFGNVTGENFPEMLDKVFLINVPWIFNKVFRLISPLLDQHTVSKFHVYNGVPKEFKDLLELDKLPKEYGGNSEVVVGYPKDTKKFSADLIQKEVAAFKDDGEDRE